MRKLFILLLAALVCLSATGFASATDEHGPDTENWRVSASGHSAVCKVAGCEDTAHTLPEAAHTMAATQAQAATCTAAGRASGQACGVCGWSASELTIPALGHSYKTEAVKATCTTAGGVKYTCERCGDTYTETNGEPLSHWYGDWTRVEGARTPRHTAQCRREDCGFTRKVACTALSVKLGDDEFTLCPICGDCGADEAGARLLDAAKENYAEPTAFAFELGGAKLVTVALEFSGAPIEDMGNYTFTLPVDALPEGWFEEDIFILGADGEWKVLENELADGVLGFWIPQPAAILKFGE